jgi:hypothetical protein
MQKTKYRMRWPSFSGLQAPWEPRGLWVSVTVAVSSAIGGGRKTDIVVGGVVDV